MSSSLPSINGSNIEARRSPYGTEKMNTRWSDIDKTRLYGIGSVMYSGLAVALHPLTVIKIRQQVMEKKKNGGMSVAGGTALSKIRDSYRGLGIVLSLSIPSRIVYVSVLEFSRERIDRHARSFICNPPPILSGYSEILNNCLPLVTPLSGGISGGLAAVSTQLLVVPMDVISQKQMVMDNATYCKQGRALQVFNSIRTTETWRGAYRGFGLSLFTSLPTGSIWWATYAGCKDQLAGYGNHLGKEQSGSVELVVRQGFIQIASALSAAFVASVLTQPLDTIKTRLQVGEHSGRMASPATAATRSVSPLSIFKELAATSGLYKGLAARVALMGIWGTVLSSAYEYLKLVSRKDYSFQ